MGIYNETKACGCEVEWCTMDAPPSSFVVKKCPWHSSLPVYVIVGGNTNLPLGVYTELERAKELCPPGCCVVRLRVDAAPVLPEGTIENVHQA